MSMIRKASRKNRYLKIGVGGISGSGKTIGALKMAYGITGDWSKIVIIDTENNSADLYAHLGDYDVLPLDDTSPGGYLKAFKEIEEAGCYEVMIIDSMSHEYAGKGGLLEIADKIASTSKSGNTFQAWSKATPLHNEWMEHWLRSKMHVIGTLRKKSDYVIEQNDKGKSAPRKVGLKAIQKEGASYEFDVLLDISMNHLCSAEKDRTMLFDGKMPFQLNEEVGKALRTWANEGEQIAASEPPQEPAKTEATELYTDTPDNKRAVFNHFKNVGIDTESTKDKMIEIHNQMIGKPVDEAEKMLVDYARKLEI